MAGSVERAINMALRVRGIGEVERDFRKVGKAGEDAFTHVERSANGADKAMSEYTARLKRVAAEARKAFDSTPGIAEARAADPAGYIGARNAAILDRVEIEKRRIQDGLPDMTGFTTGVDAAGGALSRFLPVAAVAATALFLLKEAAFASAEAYMEHERALDSFHASLALAGNQSDASASQIEAMAQRIVASTLQTEESALKAAQILATVPGITAEGLEAALTASSRLADALGTDVAEQAESTAAVLRALAERDMKALIDALDGVNPQLKATIYQLAEAGRTADAQRAYIAGLAEAAGDGPDGLTSATNRLQDAWTRLKIEFAEDFAGPAAAAIDGLASVLERFRGQTNFATSAWIAFKNILPFGTLLPGLPVAALPPKKANFDPDTGYAAQFLAEQKNQSARGTVRDFEKRYGGGGRARPSGRGGGGGRGGKSDAEREAERLKREAETARNAADRVIESNDDVVASYLRRAQEAEEKVGLEGEALKAVERRQALDAIVRRINREEIEKEVAARRAEAAAAGKQFDEAAATREAAAAVEGKATALRDYADRELAAAEATAEFARRQAQAKAILEQIKTPMERLDEAVDRAVESLRDGDITAEQFGRRMDQLAEDLADIRYEADKTAQAWRGFGDQVGDTLVDIALNGGKAKDILKELVRLPLERMLQQTVANPVADWIDGLTGNDRDKNEAAARALLPNGIANHSVEVLDVAAQGSANSLIAVQSSGMAAAQALRAVAASAGNPISDLADQADTATQAMSELSPATLQFGDALSNVLAQLSGGGGGGGVGGLLGGLFKLGVGLFGGGGVSDALSADAQGVIDANPELFASGTDSVPVGSDFWVGENGRERMRYHGGGRLEVLSHQASARTPAGGGAYFDLRGAVVTEDLLRQMNAISRREVQQGLAGYDRIVGSRVKEHLARRG